MVESTQQGDGIRRDVIYAKWRDDKEAEPGHSKELISVDVDPKYYDDLAAQPLPEEVKGCDTLLKNFQRHVADNKDGNFCGTRQRDADGKVGPYVWKTYGEVDVITQNLARGVRHLNLAPEVEGEGKQWRFIGIWAKNRWEWLTTLIANMYYNVTTVGFFDAMGPTQVDFILNQTEMATIVITQDLVPKILQLKKDGKATFVRSLIVIDGIPSEHAQLASEVEVTMHSFDAVIEAGEKNSPGEFTPPVADDVYCFSYTSGTTGDSKGVKLSHRNIISTSQASCDLWDLSNEDVYISYLPYTHSFEQVLFAGTLITGMRVGYYQGDPLKLTDDCAQLQPTLFPSVPRLYNRIYDKIKKKFADTTGCKAWLVNNAVESKVDGLAANPLRAEYDSYFYDKLVFKKVAALLGGKVRYMLTGSAPIDQKVLQFLKIAFCCPIQEGYGLTETAAGSSVTLSHDPVGGHVGGPIASVKFRFKSVPEMEYLVTDKPYPRGELLQKGPSIFSGYYKKADKTAESFDEQGWFKTGDIAMVYPNGSVKIIDRSKNIFKLSQGEYIAPEKLENIYVLSPLIAMVLVYGDSFKNNTVAIVVADPDAAKEWGTKNGNFPAADVINKDEFKKEVYEDILRLSKENKLTSLERPAEIHVTLDAFSVENDILTPTFKLKRNIGAKVYKEQIDEMYKVIDEKTLKREAAKAAQ